MRSPAGAPASPWRPLPRRRIRCPSLTPAGMRALMRPRSGELSETVEPSTASRKPMRVLAWTSAPGRGLAVCATGVEAHALPTGTTRPAEGGEDVLETGALAARAARGEAGTAVRHGADRVVLAPLLGVGQDGIRLPDLLEALLGLGVADVVVGVHGARDLAVRLLDRRGVGVLGHAEDRVEVLLEPVLTSHGAPPR